MPRIQQSLPADINTIFTLYDAAVAYQKTKFHKHWLPFDRNMVLTEMEEGRQWKIMEGNQVAGIFAIAYEDPFIWAGKNADPSIYIHRIVTNPAFRGRKYMNLIIDWAKDHARQCQKQFIRMDTWADNTELINYYIKCGFNYLGAVTPQSTEHLPTHYSSINLALFEIPV